MEALGHLAKCGALLSGALCDCTGHAWPGSQLAHRNPANQRTVSVSVSLCKIKKKENNIKSFIKMK